MCKDNKKVGPSEMSHNEAFSLPENWGGHNCLLKVKVDIICELKNAMGDNQILEFVSSDFSHHAQAAYNTLSVVDFNLENAWYVFRDLYPLVF